MVVASLKQKRILKWTIMAVIFILLLLLLLMIFANIAVIYQKMTKKELSGEEGQDYHSYRYLQLDTTTNEISVGFTESFQNLDDRFISYESTSQKGTYVLISDFGTNEYKCTGSCYCEKYFDERRITSASTTNGRIIYYLVAAISSSLAYGIASKYFEDECVKFMENECSDGNVKSEVDTCEDVVSSNEGDVEEKEKKKGKIYECSGMCMPMDSKMIQKNNMLMEKMGLPKLDKKTASKLKNMSKRMKCRMIKLTSSFEIPDDAEMVDGRRFKHEFGYVYSKIDLSKLSFMEPLHKFCSESSAVPMEDLDKFFPSRTSVIPSLCVGYQPLVGHMDLKDIEPKTLNPTVRCVEKNGN